MLMVTKVLLQAFGQDFLGTIHREKVQFTLLPLLFIDIASWILSLLEAPSQCRNQLGDVSPSGHMFVDKLIKFSVSHPIQQKTIFVMNM